MLTLLVQQAPPVIVRIVETPKDPTGLTAVLLGALGLSGVIVLIALAAGFLFGALLFFARRSRA